jgi:uncharacterized damage-inducible protein DinB
MLNNLQVLFDRCERQRKQMLQRVAGLNASQLTYQPCQGVWSLIEELHHLTLVEQVIVRLASHPEVVARQAQKFKQEHRGVPFVVVWLILRCGIRVPVPVESVLPTRDHSLSTLTRQWEQAREQIRSSLEAVEDSYRPFAVHPVCGPFTPAQALRFLLVHSDYHRRHMHRLRCARTFPR